MSKKDKKNKKGSSASSKSDTKAESNVVANPRLVAAIKEYDLIRDQAKSALVSVATIVLEEQLTKAEVVASYVEARGCTPKTAGEQYSRMKKLLTDPDTLEELRNGEVDLKTARERTAKKQSNPSPKKAAENANKVFTRCLSQITKVAKEQGWDVATIVNQLKAQLKKAGIK